MTLPDCSMQSSVGSGVRRTGSGRERMVFARFLGIAIFFVLLVSGCSSASRNRLEREPSNPDAKAPGEQRDAKKWPTTCEEAVAWIVRDLDTESKELVRNTSREDLIRFHHGWGTSIRNSFGLWQGNRALFDSCMEGAQGEEFHPDTVSMIIIERVWEALQDNGDGKDDT